MEFELKERHLGDAFKIPSISIRKQIDEGETVKLMRSYAVLVNHSQVGFDLVLTFGKGKKIAL